MTSLARETGFLTVVKPDTAPHLLLGPSIILASISTVPFSVSADPRPELNRGSVSNSLTCHNKNIKRISDSTLNHSLTMFLIFIYKFKTQKLLPKLLRSLHGLARKKIWCQGE